MLEANKKKNSQPDSFNPKVFLFKGVNQHFETDAFFCFLSKIYERWKDQSYVSALKM